MVGEYTKKVNTMSSLINNTEYVTSDGEIIEIDKRVSEHIAMDILNMEQESNVKVGNSKYIKNRSDLSKEISKIGDFYFNYYKDLDCNKHMFRYMYICTKVNFDNYLEFGNAKDENRLMEEKDLYEMLDLKRKESMETIKYLIDNKYLILDGTYIKVNPNVCKKGSMGKKIDVTRVFSNSIQELYKNSKVNEHNKLGLLIKILPLINFNRNILCVNPKENRVELIKPINLTTLSEMLGYSTTQRLKRGLMDLKVNDESVIMISKINNKDMILINPRVFYKGTDIKELRFLSDLFKIAKNN